MAKPKRRRKTASSPSAPARRRRRSPRTMAAAPARRRRRRSLSAGGTAKTMLMYGLEAMAGGVASVVLRNAMPETMDAKLKAGVCVAAGIGVSIVFKRPIAGAAIAGVGGALVARDLGAQYGIKLLSAQNASWYNPGNMAAGPGATYLDPSGNQVFPDAAGNFFYANGQASGLTMANFSRR